MTEHVCAICARYYANADSLKIHIQLCRKKLAERDTEVEALQAQLSRVQLELHRLQEASATQPPSDQPPIAQQPSNSDGAVTDSCMSKDITIHIVPYADGQIFITSGATATKD